MEFMVTKKYTCERPEKTAKDAPISELNFSLLVKGHKTRAITIEGIAISLISEGSIAKHLSLILPQT
jgi:hypothetical protein